jgi:cobalamin biosynthesis Mg chelatase CobN
MTADASPSRPVAPVQDCSTTSLLEVCQPTTTVDPAPGETSTSLDDATSTTEDVTPTTDEQAQTPTTRRTTSTTAEEVVSTTTTLSVTTSSNVLVPGDGTEGAESTTTTAVPAATVSDSGPSDGTLISLVIAGLVLIAVVVSILLWRYWVATRPPLREPADTARAG